MEPEGSLPHSPVPAACPYPEPVHTPTSDFLKIHLNIILPSAPGSPQWSLYLRFPHQNTVQTSPLHHTRYMPRPSHSSRFYHSQNIEWAVQIITSLYSFLHSPVTSSFLGPNILLTILFSKILSLRSSPNASDQVSHPYKTKGKFIILYILIFKFLDSKLEDKRFYTEWQENKYMYIIMKTASVV